MGQLQSKLCVAHVISILFGDLLRITQGVLGNLGRWEGLSREKNRLGLWQWVTGSVWVCEWLVFCSGDGGWLYRRKSRLGRTHGVFGCCSAGWVRMGDEWQGVEWWGKVLEEQGVDGGYWANEVVLWARSLSSMLIQNFVLHWQHRLDLLFHLALGRVQLIHSWSEFLNFHVQG